MFTASWMRAELPRVVEKGIGHLTQVSIAIFEDRCGRTRRYISCLDVQCTNGSVWPHLVRSNVSAQRQEESGLMINHTNPVCTSLNALPESLAVGRVQGLGG